MRSRGCHVVVLPTDAGCSATRMPPRERTRYAKACREPSGIGLWRLSKNRIKVDCTRIHPPRTRGCGSRMLPAGFLQGEPRVWNRSHETLPQLPGITLQAPPPRAVCKLRHDPVRNRKLNFHKVLTPDTLAGVESSLRSLQRVHFGPEERCDDQGRDRRRHRREDRVDEEGDRRGCRHVPRYGGDRTRRGQASRDSWLRHLQGEAAQVAHGAQSAHRGAGAGARAQGPGVQGVEGAQGPRRPELRPARFSPRTRLRAPSFLRAGVRGR